jgi:hypothetical protein
VARAEEARREARTRRLLVVITGVVAAAIVGGAVLAQVLGSEDPRAAPSDLTAVRGKGAESAPPWPAPTDVAARAEAAALPLGPMGTAEHYHAHLDVLVDGQSVPVPANIGVDPSGQMSALHTHTPDGIVHIEAERKGQTFTLGQLFTEWNVALGPDRVGGLTTGGADGKTLAVHVNGTKATGDPAMVRFAPWQEIALVYGSSDQQVEIPARTTGSRSADPQRREREDRPMNRLLYLLPVLICPAVMAGVMWWMMRVRPAPTDTPPSATQPGDLAVDNASELARLRAEAAPPEH